MKVIAFIEDEEVIKQILKHLGLWEVKKRQRSPPNPIITYQIDDQIPLSFYPDPDYPVEMYIPQ
jgi:hypothetical protein